MHNIDYNVYDEKVDKAKVQKQAEAYASREGDGLCGTIRWIDHVCANEEEAKEYINSHDKGWYDQLAVKFYEATKPAVSKTIDSLKERLSKEQIKVREYEKLHSVKNLKAEFVSCPKCKSKLKREYLYNSCPLCRSDLRSKTVLDTIAKYNTNITALNAKLTQEVNAFNAKHIKSAKVKWLVKTEFHS